MYQCDAEPGAKARVVFDGEASAIDRPTNKTRSPMFRPPRVVLTACVMGLSLLSGCASYDLWDFGRPLRSITASPAPPPAFAAADLVGRWGIAAYHKEADRERATMAAREQCRAPYTIERGPNGGVMMHLVGESLPQELEIKGGPAGTTYIGPAGEPGGPQDRAVVSFDGRMLVASLVDPDAAKLYGTLVYVRCEPRA